MKFKPNKDKYKLKTQQVKSKYLQKIRQGAQKKNISINEVALENDHMIEQGYTEEEAEQLCNFLVNTNSDWLWQSIHEVQVDEVKAGTPVLYNLMINNIQVQGLFDTGAPTSIMSKNVLQPDLT